MKYIFKVLTTVCLMALLFLGCSSTTATPYYNDDNKQIMSIQFNEEEYVWESFIFSTNRVESVK